MERYIELAKEAIERDAEEALSSLHATADVHHIGFDWALADHVTFCEDKDNPVRNSPPPVQQYQAQPYPQPQQPMYPGQYPQPNGNGYY